MVGKDPIPADLQLSELKPGLGPARDAFETTGVPVNITASTGEVICRFAPRDGFEGDLTAAIPMKADTFRKRRTRAAHAAYYGAILLVRDRDGREYVIFPPATYRDEINPDAFAKHADRALFGQFTTAPEDLPRIRAAVERLEAKLDGALDTPNRPPSARPTAHPEPTLAALVEELELLRERIARLEAGRPQRRRMPAPGPSKVK